MEKKDMALLIEVEDELNDMDKALEQLAGHGHASGEFIRLDNVFDVIYRNSHTVYSGNSEYDTNTAFLYPITGRTGTLLFYTFMLRNRSQKSLATNGFADMFLQEIRIYT